MACLLGGGDRCGQMPVYFPICATRVGGKEWKWREGVLVKKKKKVSTLCPLISASPASVFIPMHFHYVLEDPSRKRWGSQPPRVLIIPSSWDVHPVQTPPHSTKVGLCDHQRLTARKKDCCFCLGLNLYPFIHPSIHLSWITCSQGRCLPCCEDTQAADSEVQVIRNWGLMSTAREDLRPPSNHDRELGSLRALQPHERPWAWTIQQSRSWIPDRSEKME